MQSIRRLLSLPKTANLQRLSVPLLLLSAPSRLSSSQSPSSFQAPQQRTREQPSRDFGNSSGTRNSRDRTQLSSRPHPPQEQQQRGDSNNNLTSKTARVPAYVGPPLPLLQQLLNHKQLNIIDAFLDKYFDPEKTTLLRFCVNAMDARDVVLLLMRVYVALGHMAKVRRIFLVALRDLSPPAADGEQLVHGAESSSADVSAAADPFASPPAPSSFLNVGVFNGYLEALTRRKNYDKAEVIFVLRAMAERNVEPNALTYHYLIELHIRAGYDPAPLWHEAFHEHQLRPLAATVQAVLLRVVPHSRDGAFVIEVVREALGHGAAVIDKRTLAELIEQGLRDVPISAHGRTNGSNSSSSVSVAVRYPPEVMMWLMLELEVRCLLDKASFVHYIQKQHVTELLLRSAKSADATTAAEVLALMDRHVMAKTADVLSLVVLCWAQAGELAKAFDMVELMARKGYLELTDPLKKYRIESLRYVMDRHFLMTLADAVATTAGAYDTVLTHLQQRHARQLMVSVHALDVLVLAAAKMGEERTALHLALCYGTDWGVQPRTATLNCLLVGCSANHRGSASFTLLEDIYESMLRSGVQPDAITFRTLIRQSVLGDCIDDAVAYLEEVTKHPGLRVEAEMILPIMERAARVGDVETVNRVSKFSLDCDVGIDGAVLNNIAKYLAEAGQSVEVLKGHQPLHEALRSRSKVGRQRARSELTL